MKLVALAAVAIALLSNCASAGVCDGSSNPDTNSTKKCQYLKPCYPSEAPAVPTGYEMKCNGPCTNTTDMHYFSNDNIGTLYDASCDTTGAMCKAKCDVWHGCDGFTFVFNPGQYDSQSIGKCTALSRSQASDTLLTSRYGMMVVERVGSQTPMQWTTAVISESTKVAGADNTITVRLQTDGIIPPHSGIIVSGLTGSQTKTDATHPITKKANEPRIWFSRSGTFNKDSGTFEVKTACIGHPSIYCGNHKSMPASGTGGHSWNGPAAQFQFRLKNPAAGQAAVTPTLTLPDVGLTVPFTMTGSVLSGSSCPALNFPGLQGDNDCGGTETGETCAFLCKSDFSKSGSTVECNLGRWKGAPNCGQSSQDAAASGDCLEDQSEVDGALPVIVGPASCQFQKDAPMLFGGDLADEPMTTEYILSLAFWFVLGLLLSAVALFTGMAKCCGCCCCRTPRPDPSRSNPDCDRPKKYKNTVAATLFVTISVTFAACIIAFVANATLTSGISGDKGLTSAGTTVFDDGQATIDRVLAPVNRLISDSEKHVDTVRNSTDNAESIFASFTQARTDLNAFCVSSTSCAGSPGWSSAQSAFCTSLQASLSSAESDIVEPSKKAFDAGRDSFLDSFSSIIDGLEDFRDRMNDIKKPLDEGKQDLTDIIDIASLLDDIRYALMVLLFAEPIIAFIVLLCVTALFVPKIREKVAAGKSDQELKKVYKRGKCCVRGSTYFTLMAMGLVFGIQMMIAQFISGFCVVLTNEETKWQTDDDSDAAKALSYCLDNEPLSKAFQLSDSVSELRNISFTRLEFDTQVFPDGLLDQLPTSSCAAAATLKTSMQDLDTSISQTLKTNFDQTRGIFDDMIDSADQIFDNASCGFLGDFYRDFKTGLCETIVVGLAGFCLAAVLLFFVLPPFLIAVYRLSRMIIAPSKDGPPIVVEIEMTAGNTKTVEIQAQDGQQPGQQAALGPIFKSRAFVAGACTFMALLFTLIALVVPWLSGSQGDSSTVLIESNIWLDKLCYSIHYLDNPVSETCLKFADQTETEENQELLSEIIGSGRAITAFGSLAIIVNVAFLALLVFQRLKRKQFKFTKFILWVSFVFVLIEMIVFGAVFEPKFESDDDDSADYGMAAGAGLSIAALFFNLFGAIAGIKQDVF